MEKHKAVDYLRITSWKSTKLRCRVIIGPLERCHLYDVLLAGQWWPILVTGIGFLRNTGTCIDPLLPFSKSKIQEKDLG